MFPSFTGSGRRPRQVNLSGRQAQNPFAAGSGGGGLGSGRSGSHAGPSGRGGAVANAQQDRVTRQLERDRTRAATVFQKKWRGHAARKDLKRSLRAAWDEEEARAPHAGTGMQDDSGEEEGPPYDPEDQALSQASSLLQFVDLRDGTDLARLQRFHSRWTKTLAQMPEHETLGRWQYVNTRLARRVLQELGRPIKEQPSAKLVAMLVELATRSREQMAVSGETFYSALAARWQSSGFFDEDLFMVPLRERSAAVISAYRGLALHLLSTPLYDAPGGQREQGPLKTVASRLNHGLLGTALTGALVNPSSQDLRASPGWLGAAERRTRLCLLTQFIFAFRYAHNFESPARFTSYQDFIEVVSVLLSSLADEIEIEQAVEDFDDDSESVRQSRPAKSVNQFERAQIACLAEPRSIRGMLGIVDDFTATPSSDQSRKLRILATYVLALLRLFPKKGNEIRLSLYIGLESSSDRRKRPSVIRYFWQAASSTSVFQTIMQNSRAAIGLLKSRQGSGQTKIDSETDQETDDQWRLLLLFFELYNFVLLIMDDDEFFKDGRNPETCRTLTLEDVEKFTAFLKNMGFTMYYDAKEITGAGADINKEEDLSKLFRVIKGEVDQPTTGDTSAQEGATSIAGLQGISQDYVKGLVTGLMRQLYARDSRRPFLPKGHWLMTSRFDMTYFIDGVVEEEERRRYVQEQGNDDSTPQEASQVDDDEPPTPSRLSVGIRNERNARRIQDLERQQRQASQRRYLQAVAPRQQILQNMPFFIPFTTRVQIFRRFVHLDQWKRRNGIIDGEMWRMNMSMNMGNAHLARHTAKIRRGNEFDDAFEQFYKIGSSLKEPIQITFEDRFGGVEAGIDGGGVTKEFLTSVTNQAFADTEGVKMFVENDQHLLLPNPVALDEHRELLRDYCYEDGTKEFRTEMLNLLARFEFLGRIIGKCLYEGILVDIGFAGFFLLKWALTGGHGSAPRESGYRANLNDLRDYDEELYQGLLKLKKYDGDVEDFALNFTVTDTLNIPGHKRPKIITRDLKPGGSQIPVTNANRLVYISDVARHRLQAQPYHQTNAFLRGLASIIEPSWLSMFNQSELQTLIGGARQSINVADLRRNTWYAGVYQIGDDGLEHMTTQLFWQVMETMSEDERGAVLKFVTSTPRAPLLGFGSLNPRFSIRDAGGDTTRLPSTSTCVNLLKLPIYKDENTLRAKLLQAVNSGAGFDLS